VGKSLVWLRHESRLSQQQLADRSGVSRELICQVEQGRPTSLRLTTLVALSAALNVPLAAFSNPSPPPGMMLRATRQRRGMSQIMLAAQAGLTASYVSRIESGQRALSYLPTVRALATALQVAPTVLVPWLTTSAERRWEDSDTGP
jgi:transcriptional regulator with XRE-family HTH domain